MYEAFLAPERCNCRQMEFTRDVNHLGLWEGCGSCA